MTEEYAYAYLHGFASSPLSRKAIYLSEILDARGVELARPDLNVPSFAQLTFTRSLEAIDQLVASQPTATWRFVGSSMGGYLAALWASQNPERVDRMVLLCPGFDLLSRWPHILGEAVMGHWEQSGFCTFPDGAGVPTPVHWGFIEDARQHPLTPEVPCETRIIHGRRDSTVPIESSRDYAASREHVSLIEVDDEHPLQSSQRLIADYLIEFWEV